MIKRIWVCHHSLSQTEYHLASPVSKYPQGWAESALTGSGLANNPKQPARFLINLAVLSLLHRIHWQAPVLSIWRIQSFWWPELVSLWCSMLVFLFAHLENPIWSYIYSWTFKILCYKYNWKCTKHKISSIFSSNSMIFEMFHFSAFSLEFNKLITKIINQILQDISNALRSSIFISG